MSNPKVKLQDFYNDPAFLQFFTEKKISEATPVQAKVAPLFHEKDLSVVAPTGSGKTLSYALPLMKALKEIEQHKGMTLENAAPRAVILTPTRELSRQVYQVFKELSHHVKAKVRLMVQGEGVRKEEVLLEQPMDLLVCNPGRLKLKLDKGLISLKDIRYVILDEADQMLDMGFEKDLKLIFEQLSTELPPRIHLFTATKPLNFEEKRGNLFEGRYFTDLILSGTHQLSAKVETFNIYLSPKEKTRMMESFLTKEAKGKGVIFVNDKKNAETLHKTLRDTCPKIHLILLHGEMTPQERRSAHHMFQKKGGVLIATDIAARGIDLPELLWVVNYDLPFDPIYYIHRSGRVGRLGKIGYVYNFVTSYDVKLIQKINEAIQGQTAIKLGMLKAPKVNSGGGEKDAKKDGKKDLRSDKSKKSNAKPDPRKPIRTRDTGKNAATPKSDSSATAKPRKPKKGEYVPVKDRPRVGKVKKEAPLKRRPAKKK